MRRSDRRKGVILLIAGLIGIWSIYQWSGGSGAGSPSKGDGAYLLYQVAAFQMERLASRMEKMQHAVHTRELQDVGEVLYAAQYAHERLGLAYGPDRIGPLASLSQLTQYMLRLQIGGDRTLDEEERAALAEAGKRMREMTELYGRLISAGGEIRESVKSKLIDTDKLLAETINGKLLD